MTRNFGKLAFLPCRCVAVHYGAPFVEISYLTDLAQKLLSLRTFNYICDSYLCAHLAISPQR